MTGRLCMPLVFAVLALFLGASNCNVAMCKTDADCTADNEYCSGNICTLRCPQADGDGTLGSSCELDTQCDSSQCDNDTTDASCTCVVGGTGGTGGSAGVGGTGGTAGTGGTSSPCGPLPGNVIQVTADDDLHDVLTAAPGGSVILLAPGNYAPPIHDWTLPDDGGLWPSQALLVDVTLAGSGEGETTLSMTGDPYGAVGLSTYGSATIRDLTIEAREFWGVSCVNPENVTLCNVTVETYRNDAITWNPWPGRALSSLTVYESTLRNVGSQQSGAGVDLYCYEEGGDIRADIQKSHISGWLSGVSYTLSTEESCTISVSTDCEGFTDNESNVLRAMCDPPTCEAQEECP